MPATRYAAMPLRQREHWVLEGGPRTPEDVALILDDVVLVRQAVGFGALTPEVLRQLHDGEVDPELRELYATNWRAPAALIGTARVRRHTAASLASYLDQLAVAEPARQRLVAALESGRWDDEPLATVLAAILGDRPT